jgi:transketolase
MTNLTNLENIAKKIRKLTIETVYNSKAGHLGGPLSATDILTALYFDTMIIIPHKPNWENRDRFVLSKGHSAVALYSTLALRGYFDIEELETFDKINSRLQAHPDMTLLPGLDFSTGSLGQGISGAVGIALAAKLQGKDYKVYCMVGDGETQEGQFWEAVDIAAKYKLNNLIVILDNNGLQQYGFRDSMYKTPIVDPFHKLNSFYWDVINTDGHNFSELSNAFSNAKLSKNYPILINAKTIKGKGISFMEKNPSWHSRVPTDEEFKMAMEELK